MNKPFSKQESQTRTGASPHPRSGTGLTLLEQFSQKPPPQRRLKKQNKLINDQTSGNE